MFLNNKAEQYAALIKQIKDARNKLKDINKEIDDREHAISELISKFNSLDSDVKHKSQEYVNINDSLDDKKNELQDIIFTHLSTIEKREKIYKDIEIIDKNYDDRTVLLESLIKEVNSLQANKDELLKQNKSLEEVNKTAINTYKKSIDKLKKEKKELSEEKESLETDVKESRIIIDEANKKESAMKIYTKRINAYAKKVGYNLTIK